MGSRDIFLHLSKSVLPIDLAPAYLSKCGWHPELLFSLEMFSNITDSEQLIQNSSVSSTLYPLSTMFSKTNNVQLCIPCYQLVLANINNSY